MELNLNKPLSCIARSKGIGTWLEFQDYLRKVPYGRTSAPSNLAMVFMENRGTCSSKHALLKQIADENQIKNVKLILCIYKMCESNTSGIGNVLDLVGLNYIPEAHCYITYKDKIIDITNSSSDMSKIKFDMLEETEIQADQIGQFKNENHKRFLKSWIEEKNHKYSLEKIWEIREECIKNLSLQKLDNS